VLLQWQQLLPLQPQQHCLPEQEVSLRWGIAAAAQWCLVQVPVLHLLLLLQLLLLPYELLPLHALLLALPAASLGLLLQQIHQRLLAWVLGQVLLLLLVTVVLCLLRHESPACWKHRQAPTAQQTRQAAHTAACELVRVKLSLSSNVHALCIQPSR
jgi:hypothetical protein